MNVFARYAYSVGQMYPTTVGWKRAGLECTLVKTQSI